MNTNDNNNGNDGFVWSGKATLANRRRVGRKRLTPV